jgi:hypothetical protein
MPLVPTFEQAALVTDDALLAARVSSLFVRPARYLAVLDGPRMARSEANHEVVRRRYAMVMAGARRVLIGGLPPVVAEAS